MEKKKSKTTECDVCGTDILEKKFSTETDYKGKTYQFCGDECQEKFEKNPKKYAKH